MTGNDISTNVPPSTNRGVQNTEKRALVSSVDWFSATFKETSDPWEVSRIIGIDHTRFKHAKNGKFGYPQALFYENIYILYGGNENMGIHLEMSGKGCRTFEKYSNLDWVDLFIRLKVHYIARANVTRIDLAMDDFQGYFKIPTLISHLKNGSVTSLFKIARHIENIVIKTGEEKGHTLYLGRPDSDIQIRFYEKNIEQQMKGNIIPEDCTIWNRTEIQARDDRAQNIVALLATQKFETGQIISGTLKNYVNFRRKHFSNGKLTQSDNKSRWDVCPFWLKFLGDAEKIKLTMRPEEPSIPRKYRWIDKSVNKTIAILANVWPTQYQTMLETIMLDGIEKITDDEWTMIYDFKQNKVDFNTFYEEMTQKKKAYSK